MNRELTPQTALFAGGLLVLAGGIVAVATGAVDSYDPFMWTFIGATFAGISLGAPAGRLPSLPRAGLLFAGGVALGVVQVLPLAGLQFPAEVVAVLPYVVGAMDYVSALGAEE